MKKNLLSVFTALIVLFAMTACAQQRVTGSMNHISKKVKVTSFEGIKLIGSPDVIYTQKSGAPSVEIYGPDNIVSLIETYVEGENLIIKYKNNVSISNSGKLEIRVAAPAIKQVSISGSGDISGVNLKSQNVSVRVSGSGDISCYATETLTGRVSGSGSVGYQGNPRIEFSKKGLHKL